MKEQTFKKNLKRISKNERRKRNNCFVKVKFNHLFLSLRKKPTKKSQKKKQFNKEKTSQKKETQF